jgi:NADP-dependent 3-hydroxy acid dehydrogenase YdfG
VAQELQGRHALITGAGAGIGAAIALQLAQAGCRLTLCGRTKDTLQKQAELLRAQVPDVAVLIAPMDVADEHAVQAAVQQAQARFGPVNILINNAGQASSQPFAKTDAALWQQMIGVNLTGTYHCIQAVLPGMLDAAKAGTPGRIVASVTGLQTAVVNVTFGSVQRFLTIDSPLPGTRLQNVFPVSGRGAGLFEGNVVVQRDNYA